MKFRKHVCYYMKKLYDNKMITIRDGNISYKPKNENFFYISPGSIKKNNLEEEQIVKVFFQSFDNKKSPFNYDLYFNNNNMYKPSREIHIHALLQTQPSNKDKDVCIIHAHPLQTIAYMGINENTELSTIKNLFPELNVGSIGKNAKYHEAGSLDLAEDCFNCLNGHDIIGLERHGTLSIGENMERLYEELETLEFYANIKNISK